MENIKFYFFGKKVNLKLKVLSDLISVVILLRNSSAVFFCPTIPHKGVLIQLFSAAVFNDFSSNLLEKTTSQSVLHSFFPHFILLEGSLDLPISLTD